MYLQFQERPMLDPHWLRSYSIINWLPLATTMATNESTAIEICPDGHQCENGSKCVENLKKEGSFFCDCDESIVNNAKVFSGLYCQHEATEYCTLTGKVSRTAFCTNNGGKNESENWVSLIAWAWQNHALLWFLTHPSAVFLYHASRLHRLRTKGIRTLRLWVSSGLYRKGKT